ncbi:MAG: 5'-methylthioadenosine phosphorylase [Acidimicrobiia bacterium]|nr:5'-methylthioadenosine phosphorylase [Acidimicrobiia bacterium]
MLTGVGRLAIIAGSALRASEFASTGTRVVHGGVAVHDVDGTIVLQRHGLDSWSPPHRIDHRAHIGALIEAGVDRICAVSSVGSLRRDWPVGTCAIVDDFYAPAETTSFYDDPRSHIVPRFDPAWRTEVLDTWRATSRTHIHDGGVYAQTSGPRFETPAEVRALATVADLVGMTVASECIMAAEAGLAYAAVCVVDNLANGLGETDLTIAEFEAGVAANRARLITDLDALLPALARRDV